ncbi:hypothetical protein [Dictyobacter vulcani]|nr:hypothetical protein [Dictyobacter vulcani]
MCSWTSIPLPVNGKIDYRSLPQPEKSRDMLKHRLILPCDPLESQLIRI